MISTLFAKEIRSNLFVLCLFFVVLVLYIATVVSMFDPSLDDSLNAMMASMPELFAAFGMSTQATTLLDFMLNYLYGFLLTVMPFALILILINKLMIRYLDRGTMAYLLSTPHSRICIAVTLIEALVVLMFALLVLTTITELACAEMMFPTELDQAALIQANAGLFALWLFMGGLCFLSACTFTRASAALWSGGGLCIAFFLVQMISQIGDKVEFLKYLCPYTLFDPYGLASGNGDAITGAVILAVSGVVLFVMSVVVFARRDLSI